MKMHKLVSLVLFGIGAGGYFLDLDLWGVWLIAGFLVLTHE